MFNRGERVEGYSNLLYVLFLTPVFWLRAGPDALYPVSVGLNLVFAAGAWLAFARLVARWRDPPREAAARLLFGLCPALWLWTSSGMETPLILLLQVALWRLVDAASHDEPVPPAHFAVVVALSVLARADGFVVPGLAAAYLWLARRRRESVTVAVALALTLGALVAARLAYYGYPLPNTYYAKVSGPVGERLLQGTLQLLSIVLHGGLLPHVAALAMGAAAVTKRPSRPPAPRVPFELVLGAGSIAYWLYVGGDVFAERMLVLLFPIGIHLLVDSSRFPATGRPLAALATAIALFQLSPLAIDTRFSYTLDRYDRWVALGRHLAGERYAGRLLAVDAAGKIPFYSGLPTVDMLGLNDEHIAHLPSTFFEAGHNKFDPDYVLSRRPELLADWIDAHRDLRFGIPRQRYEPAGYRLAVLVYTRTHPPEGRGLIEVDETTDPAEVDVLIRRGYRYALLVRR